MDLFLDYDGRPMSREEWTAWRQDLNRVRIAYTDLGRRGRVSTVWLGLDYGFGIAGGPPLLFETMIFGGPCDGYVNRYSTRDAARTGHRATVAALRGLRVRPLLHNGRKPRR